MGRRVVVVEDDRAFRAAVVAALEHAGYDVLATGEASEAYELIRSKRPAIVILDLMLGGMYEGWNILSLMRLDPVTQRIPVIVCSAYVEELRKRAEYLRAKNAVPVEKPFAIDALLEAVEDALGAPG
jgi:CheY-like chemotaxis protein